MLVQGSRKHQGWHSVAPVGTGKQGELLFISDSLSRRQFLVDSNSQLSLLPPVSTVMSADGCGPLLSAAKSSSIGTVSRDGTRLVTICFHGCSFKWDCGSIGSIKVLFIGADFLCTRSLLVNVANHHLINATFPFKTGGPRPSTNTNSFSIG